MSTDAHTEDNAFFAQFLDDYFAECDEHLSIVRRNLLALESFVNKSNIDRAVIEELFRSFHTLKGISGMVGVTEAETLAHYMESYLRALRSRETRLTQQGFDSLMESAKSLEEVIAARHDQQSAPNIVAVLARLEALTSEQHSGGGNPSTSFPAPKATVSLPGWPGPEAMEKIASARADGLRVWHITFTPAPALAGRDINVNLIRSRLQSAGHLLHASPQIAPGGGVSFQFILASKADESLFSSWADDGVRYEEFEPQAVARPATGPAPADAKPVQTTANVVRVDLSRLDVLMQMVGDMVITRARLQDNIKRIEPAVPSGEFRALQETALALERQLRDLREGVMRVRLVPIGETFERMRFVARDAARELKKQVRIEMSGQTTEIDKLLVERMIDPLLHLVRNSVSHGIESPDERAAAGKPREGTIALRAHTEGESVIIEIEDDGRGIDAEKVAARARASGLIASDQAIDSEALLAIVCTSGFSTREKADRMSGRGVGMDVVRKTVEEIGGTLALRNHPGRGARFDIQLPLTLAIADALIVRAGDQTFAVPQASLREIVEIEPEQITAFENNQVLRYRNGALPLIRLSRFFNLPSSDEGAGFALVVGAGASAVGIVADRLMGQREIVVRAIADPLIQVAGINGATELGDGRVVLILDVAALIRSSRHSARARA